MSPGAGGTAKKRLGVGVVARVHEDAHVAGDFAPRVRLADGTFYEPRRCWVDVFDAISRARRMVYIAGWSVNTDVVLVRDPQEPSASSRATESFFRDTRDGLMATHDQNTESFFRDTRVQCVLCPRNPDKVRSYVQDIETATMFTHHQKTVIVDGGVGRPGPYDTHGHPLFRTLGMTHNKDFHQPNFSGASISKGASRALLLPPCMHVVLFASRAL